MKSNFLLLAIYFSILTLSIFVSISPNTVNSSNKSEATFVISVFDKKTNLPIENATISIINTEEYFYTNKSGSSDNLVITIERTQALNNTPKDKPWVEIDLLIYKNGYLPHLLHSLKLKGGIKRVGIVIELTPIINETNITYTESYDFPPSDWSTSIIEYYMS